MPAIDYEAEAEAYCRSLTLENIMEATKQATQRKITVESFDLVSSRRSDVHVFSELLVQYPLPGKRRPGQVVPDNMVVITEERIDDMTSYNLPFQPAPPFWAMEYVSEGSKRKDYVENHRKYERELKVPYYLLFHPDDQDLILYRHNQRRYAKVKPNEHGRLAVPELEIELALLDGYVRFWHQGELLPLPAELEQQRNEERQKADDLQRRLEAAEQELAKLRQRP